MESFKLVIPGIPLPWKAALKGTHGFYSPRHEVAKIIRECLKKQYSGPILTQTLIADFRFYMPIPASSSKKKRALMISGQLRPEGGGDRSNLAKFYEDCLQGIVIANDKQIVGGYVEKWYDLEPRTEIVIRSIY